MSIWSWSNVSAKVAFDSRIEQKIIIHRACNGSNNVAINKSIQVTENAALQIMHYTNISDEHEKNKDIVNYTDLYVT